ncbi:MAG: gliding motility protein GldN [Chitinophagia bacterium]|jgi:gliding motility associated protien GldN
MKLNWSRSFMLFFVAVLSIGIVSAQTKGKTTTPKKTTGKATAKPVAKKNTADTQVLDASASPAMQDTVKPPPPPPPPKDPFAFDSVRPSLRPDAAVQRELVKSRTPLVYEHIREDDAWYRERVWREIDIREKMNLPFRYKAEDDNGNQRFVNILLRAIRKGDVTAFDPTIDDRFTTPMPVAKVGEAISGKCDSVQVIDWAKDPTGSKGIMKDSLVCKEFNPDDIVKFRIKEEWVFDKESSKMFIRILGIAPIRTYVDEASGTVLGESPIFWVYYPDLRPVLAIYEVYNGKNFGARMSWEELFESRYFSSYIVKSTIENPYDLFVKQYIKDNILQLLEGDNIKNKIQNFELDLWSY